MFQLVERMSMSDPALEMTEEFEGAAVQSPLLRLASFKKVF
jgi:hypothetical protein